MVIRSLTYSLCFLIILAMTGGCDHAAKDDGMPSRTPEEQINKERFEEKANMPDPVRHSLLHSDQQLTERFSANDQALAGMTDIIIPDYHAPGYFIPARETGYVLNSHPAQVPESCVPYGSRWSSSPSVTAVQKYKLEENGYFILAFDNDIFSNTDYYYSSGLTFEFAHPALTTLPSRHLLPSAGRGSINSYSVSLTQTLYTPVDPDKTTIQEGDRPFASYLVLGLKNISNHAVHKTRITSRLDIGVIGPAALGGAVQKTVHDIEPVGWQNQISNDFVLNYFIQVEKGLPVGRSFLLSGKIAAEAGTLRTNLAAGANMRISNAAGYFESAFLRSPDNAKKNRVNYYLHVSLDATLVGYDATLQGGLTNPDGNVYRIATPEIDRYVFQGRLGAGINFRGFSLEAEHVCLSPEFSTGKPHMWTRLKTVFKL